ncbi:hypothetical protein TNCV_1847321 [Trichonephila clavipes]|nr:hypothetical protein TNCV_1847321 [Trichonephila clavipes]
MCSNHVVTEDRGRNSLEIKVTDLWLACHEFETSATEDPPYEEGRSSLNISMLKRWCGVKIRRGITNSSVSLVLKHRRPRHLNMVFWWSPP